LNSKEKELLSIVLPDQEIEDCQIEAKLKQLEFALVQSVINEIEHGMGFCDVSDGKMVKDRRNVIALWQASINLARTTKAYRENTTFVEAVERSEEEHHNDLIRQAQKKIDGRKK